LPDGSKPVIDRDFCDCLSGFSATPPFRLASQDDEEDEDVAADEVPSQQKSKKDWILAISRRANGCAGSRRGRQGGPVFRLGRYFVWLYGLLSFGQQTFLSIIRGPHETDREGFGNPGREIRGATGINIGFYGGCDRIAQDHGYARMENQT